MEVKLNLSNSEHKELVSYCNLNDLLVSEVVKKSFTTGFNIERYGLLSEGDKVIEKEVEKIVEKRVEVPVEVIKEVVKIEYVEVEKPVEVIKEIIKEVPVEKEVIKIVEVEKVTEGETQVIEKIVEVPVEIVKEVIIQKEPDDTKLKALEQTLQKLKTQLIDKDKKISELENKIIQVQNTPPTQVTYLRGSNLNNKLF
jgi:hypothetical protein